MPRARLVIVASLAALAASQPPPATPPAPTAAAWFRDIAADAGITFRRHASPDKRYILESMGGGVALFDYDGDGLVDIYLVDSLTVATAADARQARSALYRNLGGGRFVDVTDKAGVGHPGWGMGACTADVDGDGHDDLYVTAFGGNRLYHNNGNGSFTDIAAPAGVRGGGWSTGCGFADFDKDGDVDLFVSRYIAADLAKLPEPGSMKSCFYRGIAVQCGPRGLDGESDLLFRHDGDRFTEVGAAVGVADAGRHRGLGVAWFDYDGDGWLDLYVANDAGPSALYHNEGNGAFKDVGFALGVAVSEDGAEQGGMGVAIGDDRNAGRWSILKTNFADEANNLYRSDAGQFSDAAVPARLAADSVPYVGWGAAFFELDNDGFLDLVVANGHVYPQVPPAGAIGYRQRALLYRNRRDGTFEEVAAQAGRGLAEGHVGRGLAVGDLDNDGRLDLVINDLDGAPLVLRNERADPGHWLLIALDGTGGNRSAIGATVTVRAGALTLTRLVQSGTSYLSQDDMRRHVGLGAETQAQSIEVRWPDGTTTRRERVAANQIVTIRQPSRP